MQIIPRQGERLISFTGAALTAIGIFGIAYFAVHSIQLRFPTTMLSSGYNWILIGLHALMSTSGLMVFGISRKRD